MHGTRVFEKMKKSSKSNEDYYFHDNKRKKDKQRDSIRDRERNRKRGEYE